jgi:hypothetical protein
MLREINLFLMRATLWPFTAADNGVRRLRNAIRRYAGLPPI